MKPLIGITMNYTADDAILCRLHIGAKQQKWNLIATNYITAIENAGGLPILLPVCDLYKNDTEILDKLDGILFSGGCDVDPQYYNEDCDIKTGIICPQRDAQEILFMNSALEKTDFPVLAICRGIQLLNVAAGGSLVQDIDTEKLGAHVFFEQLMCVTTHSVNVKEGSYLEKIVGKKLMVNSYHHQCIKELGNGLECVATDSHGVIEAIEMPQREAFTLGVQWHPEGLCEDYEIHQNIFDEFVKRAMK